MKAIDELERLRQKIESGDMPPDEPLFVLRARDVCAEKIVMEWVFEASRHGSPYSKTGEAITLAGLMAEWPVKQVPGRPETRTEKGE